MNGSNGREDDLPDYEDSTYEKVVFKRSQVHSNGTFSAMWPISLVNDDGPDGKRRRLELEMPPTFSDEDVARLRSALHRSEAQSRVLFQRIKKLERDRDLAVADHDALLKKHVEAPSEKPNIELVERNKALETDLERYRAKVQVADAIMKNHESWGKEVQRSRRELKPALDQARSHLCRMRESQAMLEKKCAEKDRIAQQLDAQWNNANHLLRRAAREFMEPNNGSSESSEKSVMGSSSSLVISALAEDAVHHGLERVDLTFKSILGHVKTLEQANSGLTQSLKKQTDRANTLESILNRRLLAARSHVHVSTQCDVVRSSSDDAGPKEGDAEEHIADAVVNMDVDTSVAMDLMDTAVSVLACSDAAETQEAVDDRAHTNNVERQESTLPRSEDTAECGTPAREASKLPGSEHTTEGSTVAREASTLPSSEHTSDGCAIALEAKKRLNDEDATEVRTLVQVTREEPTNKDMAEGNTTLGETTKHPSAEDATEGSDVAREGSKQPRNDDAADGGAVDQEARKLPRKTSDSMERDSVGKRLRSTDAPADDSRERQTVDKLPSNEDVAEGTCTETARSKRQRCEDAGEGSTMERGSSQLPRNDDTAESNSVERETSKPPRNEDVAEGTCTEHTGGK